MGSFFGGFRLERLPAGELTLRARTGGSGPPLLLLHGNPETHAMWRRVAPALARHVSVTARDLRGQSGFQTRGNRSRRSSRASSRTGLSPAACDLL
jgi:haloacetate dehalogenase